MRLGSTSQQLPSLSITYVLIFLIGLSCMVVAGYFLIEGLSQFSGSDGARRMLILGGILFQCTESVCFISASALTYHSLRWRYILLTLGIILFGFSIAVMTLAQKTALQTGEAQAKAIDERGEQLRAQIQSLDQIINSYRYNAEKQSKSIYKDSRALGQDSINRAAEMEERKLALSEQLFQLNQQRRQTSSDFFNRLEQITGLPHNTTEFYFLVIRSLLLELCGIVLMSFGANLRAYNKLVADAQKANIQTRPVPKLKSEETKEKPAPVDTKLDKTETKPKNKPNDKPNNKPKPQATKRPVQARSETPPVKPKAQIVNTAQKHSESKKEADQTEDETPLNLSESSPPASGHHLELLMTMVMDMYEQKVINDLNSQSILQGLTQHCRQKVGLDQAELLSRLVSRRLEETC